MQVRRAGGYYQAMELLQRYGFTDHSLTGFRAQVPVIAGIDHSRHFPGSFDNHVYIHAGGYIGAAPAYKDTNSFQVKKHPPFQAGSSPLP
jgi:hypothetical protein